jgi:hypothetical protein
MLHITAIDDDDAVETRQPVVSVAQGLCCPRCARSIQPYDVDIHDCGLRCICGGCHSDLFIVEYPR